MPFTSHECRWFFPEPPLADKTRIIERFAEAGGWPRIECVVRPTWPDAWRCDRYVWLPSGAVPDDVDMGIKLRDERPVGGSLRLEYKARTSSLGALELAPDVVGIVERWSKWSYAAEGVPEALLAPLRGGAGVELAKMRLVRRVRLDANRGDEEIPAGANDPFPDRTLSLELARIRTPSGAEHWSLGLEAAPPDAGMHADVPRAAGPFLAGMSEVLDLTSATSASYPAWLARLAGDEDSGRT